MRSWDKVRLSFPSHLPDPPFYTILNWLIASLGAYESRTISQSLNMVWSLLQIFPKSC
jgi:hypothetical protein